MNNYRLKIMGLLIPAIGMLVTAIALAQRPGEVAPDFTLINAEGQAVRFSDFRGTPVVLNAWATWCVFCVEELPIFQAAHDDLNQDKDVVAFLLVNLSEPFEVARGFLTEEVGITVPALFDGTPEMRAQVGVELDSTADVLTRKYRVRGMPTTFLIDAEGVIQFAKIGPLLGNDELAGHLTKIGVKWEP